MAGMACIYMFEFVVDDLLITKQNLCAPEEYPTCVELSFRSTVFVSVCDREYGTCVNPNQPRCGKCCIFALDSPVTDKDVLLIHVYKKRTNRCKFLIGLTELPMKPIFDRVKESFDMENPNWENIWKEQLQSLPRMKGQHKGALDNCACYDPGSERKEQLCPTAEFTKRLLPLFNLCKQQTGNMVLIMRLLCNGPSIISAFSLNRPVCSRNPTCPDPCPPCPKPCPSCPSCGDCPVDPCCGASATGGPMDTGKKCRGCCQPCSLPQCTSPDPCAKNEDLTKCKCLRYFACNLDKMCPCELCEDEFDRECPTVPSKRCKSVIEQKLEPCGPCGGIPAYPRWVQEKKAKETADAKAEKKQQDKEKKKDEAKKKDEKRKKGGRESGGGCYCETFNQLPSDEHHDPHDPCAHCSPEYAQCCDIARDRAMRKLRHLLVKYNIKV